MISAFELAVKFPAKNLAPLFSGQAICGILAALVQIFALGVGGTPQTTGLIYFLIGMFIVFLPLVGFVYAWKNSDYFEFYLTKEIEEKRRDFVIGWDVIKSAWKKSGYYMCSMVLVLACTIMVHPGLTSLVVSVNKGNGDPWSGIFSFGIK